MTGQPALVVTGGIIIDNIVAADGAVHRATLGGNAVYAAAGTRLWEPSIGLVGVVPADYPALWLQRIAAAGIDIAGVAKEAQTGLASEWFFHRPDGSRVDHLHADEGAFEAFGLSGDRIGVTQARAFERSLGASAPRAPTFRDFRARHPVTPQRIPERFARPAALHCGPNAASAQRLLVAWSRERNCLVSLDPGFAAADLRDDLDTLLPDLDVFLPSEKELAILSPGGDPAGAARALIGRGARLVVAKLGRAGALVVTRETTVPIPVVPVEAVDPTGAGDAFCGGFLAAWRRCGDPVAAACCGAVSASFAVEHFGCLALLAATPAQAMERLRFLTPAIPPAAQDALRALTASHEASRHA